MITTINCICKHCGINYTFEVGGTRGYSREHCGAFCHGVCAGRNAGIKDMKWLITTTIQSKMKKAADYRTAQWDVHEDNESAEVLLGEILSDINEKDLK